MSGLKTRESGAPIAPRINYLRILPPPLPHTHGTMCQVHAAEQCHSQATRRRSSISLALFGSSQGEETLPTLPCERAMIHCSSWNKPATHTWRDKANKSPQSVPQRASRLSAHNLLGLRTPRQCTGWIHELCRDLGPSLDQRARGLNSHSRLLTPHRMWIYCRLYSTTN